MAIKLDKASNNAKLLKGTYNKNTLEFDPVETSSVESLHLFFPSGCIETTCHLEDYCKSDEPNKEVLG